MSPHTKSLLCITVLALSYPSIAQNLQIKPKIGINIGHIIISQSEQQALPYLNAANVKFVTTVDANGDMTGSKNANTVFFNTQSTSLSADNIDTSPLSQMQAGVQISYIHDSIRPSTNYSFGPVANIYALYEDSEHHGVLAETFQIQPKTSFGADIGIEITNNGNNLQLGGGARTFAAEYEQGDLYTALFTASDNNGNTIATMSDLRAAYPAYAYKSDIKSMIMPYAYAEASTEVGDILTAFIKVSYGFEASPTVDSHDTDNSTAYNTFVDNHINNTRLTLHTSSIGLSMRLSDYF